MAAILNNFKVIWNQIDLNQRITLAVFSLAIIAGVIGIVIWSSRPQFQLLFGGLSSGEAAEVVKALEDRGTSFQLQRGGSDILVPAEVVHRLRLDLSADGVPSGDNVGYEIFDRSSFGVSDFVQRTNYIRALQGELARTIAKIDGVRSSRVMIVVPENRLLVVNPDVTSTASVMVDIGGASLPSSAVRSIRALVANSVEGLNRTNVAVVDNQGRVLSENLDEESGREGSLSQIRARQQIESYLGEKVATMLESVLGAGQAVVRVSADIDFESLSIQEERFDPESQVLRSQTSTEESTVSRESRPPNLPTDFTAVEGLNLDLASMTDANSTDRNQRTRNQNYEISRSQISRIQNPGQIRGVTAAVFIAARRDESGPLSRSPEELQRLREMIALTLGITDSAQVSNLVSVEEVSFPLKSNLFALEKGSWADHPLTLQLVEFLPALVSLAFFLFLLRLFRRGKSAAAAFQGPDHDASHAGANGHRSAPLTPEMLNELIQQNSENVGTTLRNWMDASHTS